MKTLRCFLLLLLSISAHAAVITGTVRSAAGEALPGVSVWIRGAPVATTTDAAGRFELNADSLPATVVAFLGGFKTSEAETHGEAVALRLELDAITETVTVTAKAPPVLAGSSFELRPLDVLRTPGAQADLFRALQTLPGIVKIDEGAGLFVRGGDVSEVKVMLDGTTIAHPFRQETPSGGQFGSVPPLLLEGLAFSTGGFSAKYGNALSAVLELRGLGQPRAGEALFTAGFAGLAVRASDAEGEHAGFRASGNLSTTRLLFDINGAPRQFDRQPGGWDLNASAHFDSSSLGAIKIFAGSQADHVGVSFQREAFDGFLHSSSRQDVVAASWKAIKGPWQLTSALGVDQYAKETDAGVLDIATKDRRLSWRFDAVRAFGSLIFRGGADAEQSKTQLDGTVSLRGDDFGGVFGTKHFNVDYGDDHGGAYVEVERKVGIFTPTIGIRTDRDRLLQGGTVDPRVNIVAAIAPNQSLRLAWGLYHQAPAASYYDRSYVSRPDAAMQAQQWIAGYEAGAMNGPFLVRIEAYAKRYTNLPLDDARGGFNSAGYGWARGLDFFAHRKWARLDLRTSVSLLEARRRWTAAEQRQRFQLPAGTWRPDFDIPRALDVSALVNLTPRVDMGLAMMYASGRPQTPIVGATRGAYGFQPIYGAINSERLPSYVRCDLNATYRTSGRTSRSSTSSPSRTHWPAPISSTTATPRITHNERRS
jgi:vitamin B12 transporter